MLIRRIGVISRTYRQIERYSEILGVLFKFGFGDLVISLKVERYLDIGRQMMFRKPREHVHQLSRAERVRLAVEELGPTFIKLGQMLSTRPHPPPKGFVTELIKLQDKVPPFPFQEARRILEEELGPIEKTYAHIEPEPIAAASLGQVHRARLLTGEDVVVKVQRPGLRSIIEVDLEIMLHMATLLERHVEGWDIHKPTDVVDEFGRTLERELDYSIEASNMERFTLQHADNPFVHVPMVYHEATTARVLTMEFVRGIKADNFDELKRQGYNLKEIADHGGDLVMEQIMIHGFYHADPHPGNLLVLPGHVICLLDMGMTGRIERSTREYVVDLITAAVQQDPQGIVNALLKLTDWFEDPDRKAMVRMTATFLDKYLGRPLKEIHLSVVLQELFDVALGNRLRVPPDLLILIKAISVTENLARQLDPDFDITAKAEPYVRKVQLSRLNPLRAAVDTWEFSREVIDFLKILPGDLRTIITLARKGKFKIEVDNRGFDEMLTAQARAGNRIAYAVVLGALIVGSSIIVLSGIPPTWRDIPIIGLVGYVVAGIMGFWLLITFLRRGMM